MSTKRLGFDFDKIFVNYPPFIPDFIINYFYKKHDHDLKYRFPGVLERKIRIMSHAHLFRPPIQANIESLKKNSGKNKIMTYLISSRFSFLKDRTREWNKKYDIFKYFTGVYFNEKDEQPHIFKNRIIKREKIDKYVDDDLDLLLYLARENPKVEFYCVGPSTGSDLPHNIKRINNLAEFFEKYV